MRPALGFMVMLIAAGGCIPSSQLAEGELDRYWALTADPTPTAPLHYPTFGERRLPARWLIRQEPSLILSTISIVRAFETLKKPTDEIAFSISPTHTEAMQEMIGEVRVVLEDLSELVEAGSTPDRKLWTQTMGQALVGIERVARLASIDESQQRADGESTEPVGLAAGPLLQMLVLQLNESSGGTLLEDLDPEEIDRLRAILTQVVLRVGFDVAGKELPPQLRETTVEMMRRSNNMDALESELAKILASRVDQASPSARVGQAARVLRVASNWAPQALEVVEAFILQWDRMDSVDLEFRHLEDQPLISAVVRVQPGKEVRLSKVSILQPDIVFRGASRIVIVPEAPVTREVVLLFEPIEDGAVDMRFKGLVYGLARMFAIPLASGPLREIRVFTASRHGETITNASVLMESSRDKKDPRRMLVFQDARKKRTVREAFSLTEIEEKTEQIFNYFSSDRRYTYRRLKAPAAEAGK